MWNRFCGAKGLGVIQLGVKQVLKFNTIGCDTVGVKQVLRCNIIGCYTVVYETGFEMHNN